MPYVAADGPPDIDATHAWTPAAGTPPPTLNDRQTDPSTLPWIKVLSIAGWRDHPEITDNRAGRTAIEGEIAYPSRTLGKTVVYECEVRAVDRLSMRALLSGCAAGFGLSRSDEGVMTVTPYASPGGVVWTFTARVIAFAPTPAFSHFPKRRAAYRWGFTVSLRMSDPRFYTGGVGYL